MSDFLGRLAARSLGLAPVVAPRLPSLFEPPPGPATSAAAAPARPGLGLEGEGRGEEPPAVSPEAASRPAPLTQRRAEPTPDTVAAPRPAPTTAPAITPPVAPSPPPAGPSAPPFPAQASRSGRDEGHDAPANTRSKERAALTGASVGQVPTGLAPVLRAASDAPGKPPRTVAAPAPARSASPGPPPPSPPGLLAPSRLPHFPQLAALAPAALRPEPRPRVEVTIGRIEVRATATPSAAPARRATASAPMSLEEYLGRRDGRRR